MVKGFVEEKEATSRFQVAMEQFGRKEYRLCIQALDECLNQLDLGSDHAAAIQPVNDKAFRSASEFASKVFITRAICNFNLAVLSGEKEKRTVYLNRAIADFDHVIETYVPFKDHFSEVVSTREGKNMYLSCIKAYSLKGRCLNELAHGDKTTAEGAAKCFSGAIGMTEELKKHDHATTIDASLPQLYSDRGICFTHAGDYENASADFSSTIGFLHNNQHVELAKAYHNRAVSRAAASNFKDAASDFTTAIANYQSIMENGVSSSKISETHHERARCLYKLVNSSVEKYRSDKSQELAKSILEYNKQAIEDYDKLTMKGDQENLLKKRYQNMLISSACCLDGHVSKDEISFMFEKAIPIIKSNISHNPLNSKSQLDLARCMTKLRGDPQEIVKLYDKCLHLLPKDFSEELKGSIFFERGVVKTRVPELTDGSLSDFTSALSLNRQLSEAFYNRSLLYFRKEDFASALKDIEAAVDINKADVEYFLTMFLIQNKLKLNDQGKMTLNRVLELDSANKAAKEFISHVEHHAADPLPECFNPIFKERGFDDFNFHFSVKQNNAKKKYGKKDKETKKDDPVEKKSAKKEEKKAKKEKETKKDVKAENKKLEKKGEKAEKQEKAKKETKKDQKVEDKKKKKVESEDASEEQEYEETLEEEYEEYEEGGEEEAEEDFDEGLFEDVDVFPANSKSILGDSTLEEADIGITDLETEVQWLRPKRIDGVTEPCLFIDGASYGDVVQGALGDCWALSAFSIIASHDNLMSKIILEDQCEPSTGQYTFCFFKEGEKKIITIDDKIPCNTDGAFLFSSSNNPNELWVPLLEKAYAALFGSYAALVGGQVYECLEDLTGGVPYWLTVNEENKESIWECILSKHDTDGSQKLLGSSCDTTTKKSGLIQGHAYAILDAYEVPGTLTSGKRIRLIKMRNPWGAGGEWKGDWCDSSPLWTSEIRKSVGNETSSDDGIFFMSLEDFVHHWTFIEGVEIFDPKIWDEHIFKSPFKSKGLMDENWIDDILLESQYLIENQTDDNRVVLCLTDYDTRYTFDKKKEMASLAIYLIKYTGDVDGENTSKLEAIDEELFVVESEYETSRDCFLSVKLPAGKYIAIPHGCNRSKAKQCNMYTLRIVSESGVVVTELP